MDHRVRRPALNILETGRRYGEWRHITITIDNTSQKTPTQRTIGHHEPTHHAADVRGSLGLVISMSTIKEAIADHYAHVLSNGSNNGPDDAVTLTVPPGTCQEFTLRWRQVWHVGHISLPHKSRRARYRYPGQREFQLLASRTTTPPGVDTPPTRPRQPLQPAAVPEYMLKYTRRPRPAISLRKECGLVQGTHTAYVVMVLVVVLVIIGVLRLSGGYYH